MEEIRFHGRGGQGTVLASIMLAKAFYESGYNVQTFPLFGVERRGAPVDAYLRIDKKEILVRNNVYEPDHIIIQDSKIINVINVTTGLKKNGWILINRSDLPDNLDLFKGFNIAYVDANKIALKHKLGTNTHPFINTSMLGAFSKTFNKPSLKFLKKSILSEIPHKKEENVRAAEEAYEKVFIYGPVK